LNVTGTADPVVKPGPRIIQASRSSSRLEAIGLLVDLYHPVAALEALRATMSEG
jgi:hypothetical protein